MVIERFILTNILGWTLDGNFPKVDKSVVVFAPHTSYIDAVMCTLCLRSLGMEYRLLSKKELFFFPMNIVMKLLNAIPVRGVKGHNAIYETSRIIQQSSHIHIVICPEGTLKPKSKWDPGFYYIASKSGVPIVAVYMDFKQRKYGVKGLITSQSDRKEVYDHLRKYYTGVTAYYPEKFVLPE
ncbi:MAG: 1-acyl-sn-glycerol-3-phosphate acyltransferase [Bacteroidales bacterium]|nr:1-acyl-sn-glycerol-3-phosphate acyltransferase [Bacteroidales bacterium]